MFAFTGILLGLVSSIIMQTILATVLPSVVEDLGGENLYSWVFSIYLISSTITIPIFAKLADLYGRKRFYLGGMVIYLVGSALNGIAQTMGQLVIYRVIQGLGAGALAPAAIAMISDLFPIKERGKMMGMLATTQVLANILGPFLGGLVADNFGWQWAFWATLPSGILALILVAVGFTDSPKEKPKINLSQIDFIGGLLLGIAIVFFIQGFEMIKAQEFRYIQTGLIFLVAVFIFAIFIRQERHHPDPVVSSCLIATKNIKVCLMSTFLMGTVMYGAIVVLPLFGQALFGKTALQGGKLLIPLALGLGAGGIFSGKLTKKISYANFVISGWLVVFLGFCLLALFCTIQLSYYPLSAIVIIIGFGLGVIFPTLLISGQNAVAENQRAVVGGLVQMTRNLGGAVGIPLFTGFITQFSNKMINADENNSYLMLFILLAIVSLVGVVIGSRFKGSFD